MEPPPRPQIITSQRLSLLAFSMHSTIDSLAFSPCTSAGYKIILHRGNLLPIVLIISWTAAPVGEVITPTTFGIVGILFYDFDQNIQHLIIPFLAFHMPNRDLLLRPISFLYKLFDKTHQLHRL